MVPPNSSRPLSVAVCTLIAIFAAGCSESEPAPELPHRAIRWMTVSDEIPSENRVISGIVTSVDETRLAFEVGGTVLSVDVNLGDRVERNQMLARLDPEPFELTVRDGEAALAEAVARRQAAQANFERTTALFRENVASQQELDRDTAQRDSTSSQVEAAQARLNLAKRDLRRSVLRAPFTGSISVRSIDPAEKVTSGVTAFEMDSEESGLRVEVQMPETLISRVKRGAPVEASFPSAPGHGGDTPPAQAVISEVGTRAGSGNSFPVRADLVEKPEGIRPGMTAELRFTLPRVETENLGIDGFLIPFAAVRAEENERFKAFVFDESTSTVRSIDIETGGIRDNDVAVLSGLKAGDIIATAGVSFLRDGQTVRLADERWGSRAR